MMLSIREIYTSAHRLERQRVKFGLMASRHPLHSLEERAARAAEEHKHEDILRLWIRLSQDCNKPGKRALQAGKHSVREYREWLYDYDILPGPQRTLNQRITGRTPGYYRRLAYMRRVLS